MPFRILLILTILLHLPLTLRGQEPRPVHLIATGGTISNTEGERLTGEGLVRGLPGVERIATLTVEQFSNVASGAITLEQWRALDARIDELFRARPELEGIIVTHGTDTMEETAYFLSLTVTDCRPVVLTGAMRRATDIGADGPANLFNAIRLAVHPDARRLGAVVLMNDEIFPAREVSKINTSRMNAFTAPGAGRIGVADPDSVVLPEGYEHPACGARAFDLSGVTELPRVDVIYSYLGADGALIRAAVAAGAKGIVLAGVGRGGATPGQQEALRDAMQQGVHVVRSNRTGSGRVPVASSNQRPQGGPGSSLGAGDLTPQKARILLMLALTRTDDPAELRAIFGEY